MEEGSEETAGVRVTAGSFSLIDKEKGATGRLAPFFFDFSWMSREPAGHPCRRELDPQVSRGCECEDS